MNRLRKIGLVFGLCLGCLTVLELGCYAYLRFMPARFNHMGHGCLAGMVGSFHPLFRPMPDANHYYPYIGDYRHGDWSRTPPPADFHPDGWVQVSDLDEAGRQRYTRPEKRPGVLRIAALGGSTMAGWGLPSPEGSAIPARMEEMLRKANPGRDIEVVNFSYAGLFSAEEMVLLGTKVLAFRPDLVLVVDGVNEFVRVHFYPDMPPYWGFFHEYLRRTYERTQTVWGCAAQLGYALSKSFYCLAAVRAWRFERARSSQEARAARVLKSDPAPLSRAIEEYLQTQLSMKGIAQAHRIPLLLAFQPNLYFHKPKSPDELRVAERKRWADPTLAEGAQRFYEMTEARYRPFAAAQSGPGVRLLNLCRLFEGRRETLYFDDVHYNPAGTALMARALAGEAAAVLRLRAP